MGRLKLDEWLPYALDRPGRWRINHVAPDCDGGRDSMIVERKEDGSANAYCFRCGRSGYSRGVSYFKSPREKINSGLDGSAMASGAGSKTKPPHDSHGEWAAFPRNVREWLLTGGVTSVISGEQGILWSESTEKLWVPVRKLDKQVGWVERGFNPKSCRNRTEDVEKFYGYYLKDSVINNDKIVIVEDVISAIKVKNVVDCIALLGTYIKPDVISTIGRAGYKSTYIFLDADNPIVKMKAREISKRLPFVACKVIETGKDPKHHSVQEIEELIK